MLTMFRPSVVASPLSSILTLTEATEVVPETLEAALTLVSNALHMLKVPPSRVIRAVGEIRGQRYKTLRSVIRRDPAGRSDESGVFREELQQVVAARRNYLGESGWCRKRYPQPVLKTIAYFSMEFGLGEALPLYAGGLGILAGDVLKTASDLDVPMVGIGLLYQEGYFRQILDWNGWQIEAFPYNDPLSLPAQPALLPTGEWLRVPLDLIRLLLGLLLDLVGLLLGLLLRRIVRDRRGRCVDTQGDRACHRCQASHVLSSSAPW